MFDWRRWGETEGAARMLCCFCRQRWACVGCHSSIRTTRYMVQCAKSGDPRPRCRLAARGCAVLPWAMRSFGWPRQLLRFVRLISVVISRPMHTPSLSVMSTLRLLLHIVHCYRRSVQPAAVNNHGDVACIGLRRPPLISPTVLRCDYENEYSQGRGSHVIGAKISTCVWSTAEDCHRLC